MSFASTEWVKDLLKKVTKKTTLQPGRIDGVLYQNDIPIVLTKSINVYLDANGNDTTGDGTQANPFKTFKGLMAFLPRESAGYSARVNIYISGDYVNVDFGGLMYINYLVYIYFVNNPTMTFDASFTTSYTPFWFDGCSQVWIESGNLTMDSSACTHATTSIYFYNIYFRASNVRISSANITITGNNNNSLRQAGFASQRSNIYMGGVQTISGCYWGCYYLQASHVFMNNVKGTNNNIGICAAHGTYCGINITNYSISGSTRESHITGSTVVISQ